MKQRQQIYSYLYAFTGYLIILLTIYYALTMFTNLAHFTVLWIGLALIICTLKVLKEERKTYPFLSLHINEIIHIIFIILSVIIMVWFWKEFMAIRTTRMGVPNNTDILLGFFLLVLILETTRRELGPSIPIMVMIFYLYGLMGPYLPGYILRHFGMNPFELITQTVSQYVGIYGMLGQLAATVVAIFLFYAGIAKSCGLLKTIYKGTRYLERKSPYLIPQAALVSSLVFGSISGSSTANAAATGSFTIPLMKRYNISAIHAASIEAAASTAGQIMPPIMGAGAFVMMQFVGVSYYQIIIAALPPALLFYLSYASVIHLCTMNRIKPLEEEKDGIEKTAEKNISKHLGTPLKNLDTRLDIWELVPPAASIGVLIYYIGYLRKPVLAGGYHMIYVYLITQLLYLLLRGRKLQGLSVKDSLIKFFKDIHIGVDDGAYTAAKLGVMLSTMGIAIRIIGTTALGHKLSISMFDLAGDSLLLLILLVALLCEVFGKTMSTTASYILVAVMAAPALIRGGFDPLVAHFFVFYVAITSVITPPVATTSAAAAEIADASYMKVTFRTMRISLSLFLLPFIFLSRPEILRWSWETVPTFIMIFIGLMGLNVGSSIGLVFGNKTSRLSIWVKSLGLIGLGGIVLFYPGLYANLAALILTVTAIFAFLKRRVLRRIIQEEAA